MIRCGLDWSGDTGSRDRGGSRWLSIALVAIDDADLPTLYAALEHVRTTERLRPGYIFKYANAGDSIRDAFARQVARVPLAVYARVVEKDARWEAAWSGRSGGDRLRGEIRVLAHAAAIDITGPHELLVDLPRTHTKDIQAISLSLRHSLRPGTAPRVKPCPDSQMPLGELVQTADMFAGWLAAGDSTGQTKASAVRRRVKLID